MNIAEVMIVITNRNMSVQGRTFLLLLVLLLGYDAATPPYQQNNR